MAAEIYEDINAVVAQALGEGIGRQSGAFNPQIGAGAHSVGDRIRA